jgi:hypothetical protein
MKGQRHFTSKPVAYSFEINRDGAKAIVLDRNEADRMIEGWHERRAPKNQSDKNTMMSVEKIKKECGFDEESFKEIQKSYMAGDLSVRRNICASADRLKAIELDREDINVCKMPSIYSDEY